MGRRLARELALKILYCYEEGQHDFKKIMHNILDMKKYTESDKDFSRRLIEKTLNNLGEIDKEIIKVIKNWEYNRISVIDKLLLRLGTCELLYFTDIPHEVIINEAIEIGKKYSTEESGRFINGILDAIAVASRKEREHEGSNNR